MRGTVKRKILVVDDDATVLRETQHHLSGMGYIVETDADVRTAIMSAKKDPPSLILLDICFPRPESSETPLDGIDAIRAIRRNGAVPIMIMSSTTIPAVKVMALSIGADDYVCKPVNMDELSARIEAILRRARDEMANNEVLTLSRLQLDPIERRAWKDGELISFTPVEFDILHTLAKRPDHVYTRGRLLDLAWNGTVCSIPKVIDVHVGHIRRKLEDDPANPEFITTVRGAGYRFQDVPALRDAATA